MTPTDDNADIVLTRNRRAAAAPDLELSNGQYLLRFAANAADLDQVLRLRFAVFNLELREGLDESYRTCRDRDDFDGPCHHLMVIERHSGDVIGTYRMQTAAMAGAGQGFYSNEEFNLDPLRASFLPHAIELGRACIATGHRNSRVLYLLWRGLAAYMVAHDSRYFFGCCSLTSQDPGEGQALYAYLQHHNLLSARWRVQPRRGYACDPVPVTGAQRRLQPPRLMKTYLDYGARIAGGPAIDRRFRTIDYLAVFDLHDIGPRVRRMFFA